ncbi:alpha/beta fold hydrolase [Brachybacterium sp. JHP9]|uniref:Alpha/beta fold hydrolase n=1 Tax=Brachybacterium equifaecis TaxID=2910770 RepID=A0ABT0R0N2_9MICO|nr:alpha/beta fold hydrolase [Brachybacterium equifaecis]MCL6423472.1 alpha/beta fold hydrolase [Brachybacterium equifaecis]
MAFSELSRPWRSAPHSNPAGGLLLCHGFTGSPQSLRPWAEHHAAAGWDVELPLLPGHALTWQEMARTDERDWYGEVRAAALALLERHERISLGGLSMGGALALRLAQDPGIAPRLDAVVLVNAVARPEHVWRVAPLLAPVLGSLPGIASDIRREGAAEEGYDRTPLRAVGAMRRLVSAVRRDLPRVTAPVLIAVSPQDHTVPPRSSDLIAARVRGPVERLALPDSYHVATLDHDAERLFAASSDFLLRRRAAGTDRPRP